MERRIRNHPDSSILSNVFSKKRTAPVKKRASSLRRMLRILPHLGEISYKVKKRAGSLCHNEISYKEKHRRGLPARLLASTLAMILTVSAAAFLLPPKQAQAAGSTQEMANLVIFVKENGDTADVFNASSTYSNWEKIKQIYDTGTGTGFNNSFSNYISVITEGRLHVTNYFPQESSDKTRVVTYELSGRNLDRDVLVSEVLRAVNSGKISVDTSAHKMDNLKGGILDNLTIVIQRNTTSSGDSDVPVHEKAGFRAWYNGTEKLKGLTVSDYNVLYSDHLVSIDGSLTVTTQQGVVAHEFLHTLGFPDLYRYDGSGQPVGLWDVMASTSCFLQYPLSYLRAKQGWVSMGSITQSGTYILTAVSKPGGNKVFALKTPLSDTETICLEYRLKDTDLSHFEHKIPSTGLIMYRVDDKVDGQYNGSGKNYIYVYRPGATDPDLAADKGGSYGNNLHWEAALDGSIGKGSYGSTDLSVNFSQNPNILYYSDGRNSGIRISDVKLSSDQTQVTFTVTFADYSDAGLWEKVGGSLGSSVIGPPCLYTDPATGALYTAYSENGSVFVKKWNGNAWQAVGSAISQSNSPALAVSGGTLYLSCINAASNAVYYKLSGSAFSRVAEYNVDYPKSMQFIADGDELYGAYEGNGRLVIRNIKTNALVTDSLSCEDFCSPALVKLGDCFYMVCSEFKIGSPGGPSYIQMYDTVKKSWSKVHTLSNDLTNTHCIVKQGQKLYAFAGYHAVPSSGSIAVLAEFDGNSWRSSSVPGMASAEEISMHVIDNEVYFSYNDTADKKAKVLKRTGSSWLVYNDTLGTSLSDLKTCNSAGTLYAVTKAMNTEFLSVWKKTVSTGQSETPTVGQKPLQLTLTPPAGYGDSHIYVDGIDYAASKSGGSYSVTLPNTSGKTAVMYCYNANNVPTGMYVWKLSWQGQICRATPLPGLQDLLSYHGFSIRIQDPAGIRFSSGIDVSLKRQLLSTGVDGCRLTEYGTLFITNENRKTQPFVKGGNKVGGGRAYWTENGKVYDKVFSTVAGRNRFTSVLINLTPRMYATDICFRSYAILTCDGQELIIYGPPVYRSVYTVAKQVQAKGEFKAGSNGYKYIQGIINSVEGK